MNKRVIKLDQKQLRSIISEAIQGRQPGSPLFTPPDDRKNIHEADLASTLPGQLADTVQAHFEEQFDPSDPSMQQSGGRHSWNMQCAAAAEEFASRVNELLQEIETNLVNGEYYRG